MSSAAATGADNMRGGGRQLFGEIVLLAIFIAPLVWALTDPGEVFDNPRGIFRVVLAPLIILALLIRLAWRMRGQPADPRNRANTKATRPEDEAFGG